MRELERMQEVVHLALTFGRYSELDKMGMGRYQICIWFLCG